MTIVHAPKCTGCGSPLNAPLQRGKIKCEFCGTLIIVSSQEPRSDEKICPECEAVNPIDAIHCTRCRAKLIFPCPACKATNIIGAVYCVRCGTDMKAEAVRQANETKQRQEEAKWHIEKDAKRKKVLAALVLIPSVVFLLIFAISPIAISSWINNQVGKIIGIYNAAPNTTNCINSGKPTDQDVTYANNFTTDIFQGNEWKRNEVIDDAGDTITWRDSNNRALISEEYLINSCGYSKEKLNNDFSNPELMLEVYEKPSLITTCSNDKEGLNLYEYRAEYDGQIYIIRIWTKLINNTHLIDIRMVFPEKSLDLLNQYSLRLFPTLKSCAIHT